MPEVTLVSMTDADLHAFIAEEIADYADERVCDGTWSRHEAPERARLELLPVIAWEHQAQTDERQRLWTAVNAAGQCVGWVWVKLGPEGAWSTSAFLCQITVMRTFRRQGYGHAILAALETKLADEGIAELRLNVWESNVPAKRLYTEAGYEVLARSETMRQLRKRLTCDADGTLARRGSSAAERQPMCPLLAGRPRSWPTDPSNTSGHGGDLACHGRYWYHSTAQS